MTQDLSRADVDRDSLEGYELDPLYLSSRREAVMVLGVFAVFAGYVLTVCYQLGFRSPSEEGEIATVLGMPAWVFWGIVLPWLFSNLITGWFCLFYMKQEPLEEVQPPTGNEE